MCLHWETNLAMSSVMEILDECNFELVTNFETTDHIQYVFKYQSTMTVKHERVNYVDHEVIQID